MNEISREVVREVVVCERSEAKHYILIFRFQKILSGPCGNQGVLGGEHSHGEFIWSSKDTIFNRLTHANTLSCSCSPQAVRVAHTTLCRAFGAYGNIQAINWQEH